ncbi:MAG: hypothetical protein HQL10_02780 [Nitrospirae bacterium]|nr:hypothetical protein [Nitrospirota bacterium]
MELKETGQSEITILGNIRNIEDYLAIKKMIITMIDKGEKNITIKVIESMTMNSSIIGFMLKVVFEEKIILNLRVKNDILYNLLKTLNLVKPFHVKKIKDK